MANVLSLALRVTADASGLKLDPVQRALVNLGDQAEKLTKQFDKFSGGSEAAAKAQANFDKQAQDLINTLRDGGSATEFAAGFERLTEAVNKEAAAFERAARITEANLSPLERFDRAQTELNEQVEAGRISLETYNRATESAAKGLTDAERAARGLAVQQKEIDNAAGNTTLKFNELSGVFSVLPGPLGNIAGRISGISSASEGLSRVFAGGLKAGLTSIASSVTALINPFTLALAGITGFGVAASSLVSGLVSLEDRVERLGNLATQLGVSFEFVQVLEEAGIRTGVSLDSVASSMTRLQRTLAGADEESKQATAALARLGVSVQQLDGLTQQQQIELIGKQIASIEDPAKRTAAAVALFGRSGVQLLPFFRELPGAANDLERFGAALSDEDRARIDGVGASFDSLGVSLRALSQSVLVPFSGVVAGVIDSLTALVETVTRVSSAVGSVLSPVFDQVGTLFSALGSTVSAVGSIVLGVFEALEPVLDRIGKFLLPAVVAQMVFLNRQIIAGAISGLAGTFAAAGGAAVAYATGAGTASAATAALAVSVRALLASTGVGALVVAFGFAADALISWATASDNTAESLAKNGEATDKVAESASQAAEQQKRAAEELSRAIEGGNKALDSAIAKSGEFGQAGFNAALEFQTALADLQEQADAKELNAEQYSRGVANATKEYERQIEAAKKVAEENKRIADEAERQQKAITDRVDGLLAKANEIPQIEQDINAVESEIARVEAAQIAARELGATEQANALAARLSQLDQLQAGLLEQQDEAAQGFAQGFDDAFASVDSGVSSLIDKASEFGQAGFDAALELQNGIAKAQQQARDGILNKEAFAKEVERQKKLYEQRLDQIKEIEKVNEQIAGKESELRDKQFEVELARVEELANVRTGSVEINDLRSGGISQFFETLQEDPAIAEAKKQTKELEKMRKELAKLQAEKVEILAGTG